MNRIKSTISFIATVYNEEKTVEPFIQSIFEQTKKTDEIIITDGGSTDNTLNVIARSKATKQSRRGSPRSARDDGVIFKVITKKGNRSVGRNEAIKHATGDVIVCSDAGNILDREWLAKITEPFENKDIDVVAGYYNAFTKTVFQKCLLPYVFVMPDKINPDTFLPATRSVAFRKSIWKRVGGFNEALSHNEDYAFAKALQKVKAKIFFAKDAIVYWIPRTTFKEAFIMFFRFAYGDAEAKIYRPKVILLVARYLVAILLLLLSIFLKSAILFFVLLLLFLLYLVWAVIKNYNYVKEWHAIFILPALQLVADGAVLKGTLLGLFNKKINL